MAHLPIDDTTSGTRCTACRQYTRPCCGVWQAAGLYGHNVPSTLAL